MGEKGGISDISNWQGGGDFAYFIFDKTQEKKLTQVPVKLKKKVEYHQLDFFSLFDKYGDEPIADNSMVHEDINWEKYGEKPQLEPVVDETRNVLISLVKKDNEKMFLDGSATIYYTGKKFPASVALNKLFYFMPYIKGKGVRDLFLIRIARLGYRKEGTPEEDKNDLRLVLEVQFVKQLFDDYKPVELKIWRTFTDTTIGKLIKQAYV